jgi:hypothetical protein
MPVPPYPCDDMAMAPVERKFFLHPTLSSHATFTSEDEARRFLNSLQRK